MVPSTRNSVATVRRPRWWVMYRQQTDEGFARTHRSPSSAAISSIGPSWDSTISRYSSERSINSAWLPTSEIAPR